MQGQNPGPGEIGVGILLGVLQVTTAPPLRGQTIRPGDDTVVELPLGSVSLSSAT